MFHTGALPGGVLAALRRPPSSTLPAPLSAMFRALTPSAPAGVLARSSTSARRVALKSSRPAAPPSAASLSVARHAGLSLPVADSWTWAPSRGNGVDPDALAWPASRLPMLVVRISLLARKVASGSMVKRSPGTPVVVEPASLK